MESDDIRWKQRFSNFNKALEQLGEFNGIGENLDYYEYQGETNLQGSRDVIQLAFNRRLVFDGEGWMQMLKDRNKTSHTYNQETAEEIASNILSRYFKLFKDLQL